jgi:glycine hydroxymethyltransferase
MSILKKNDPEIAHIIDQELERIENTIDLIASENYTSSSVMETTGSVMTNKYAEGYPHKRYYGGCEYVDAAEIIAQKRALEMFRLSPENFHVNVQPHSGAQANMAAFFALLQPGDTILGMDLAAGGHLTHGYKINFSGVFYKTFNYTVDPTSHQIDFDQIMTLAQEYKPKLIIAGASAYSRHFDFKQFKMICNEVGAYFMVDLAHVAGLVAAELHPDPFQYADVVTMTTHKTLRGPRGGMIICKKEYGQTIDKAVMPGIQGGPLMHHIAAKAVAFKEVLTPEFKIYQKQVLLNSKTMAQAFIEKGYSIVSHGTDNHLMVIDVRNKNITGKTAEQLLGSVGICLNKNCIPFDPEKPFVTSGIRIGTPAITTRGMKEEEALKIVDFIDHILSHPDDIQLHKEIAHDVQKLCLQFPVYR